MSLGVILIGILGLIDYLTGYEISFSLFYLAPIALVAWFAGRPRALVLALLSAGTWLAAEIAAGRIYTHPAIPLWNTLIRFGFFLIVTNLLSELRKTQEAHRAQARIDYVSGAVNARHFTELVEMEIERSRRYSSPFTLAYVDLDNFKQVNDRLGHATGDEVLRTVASEMKICMRTTDVVARLGGDEFGLLLPATGGAEAEAAISKLHRELTAHVRQMNWPVTFSIGVVISTLPPESVDELIRMADQLMYTVKNTTKNSIRFDSYPGEQSAAW